MSTEPRNEDQPAPDWEVRLEQFARGAVREVVPHLTGKLLELLGGPEIDGRLRACGFIGYIVSQAVRPEAETPQHSETRIDEAGQVVAVTAAGQFRLIFAGEVGDWAEPATAARIRAIVRTAVYDELGLGEPSW